MPGQQQDYILRHIQTISRLIARMRLKGKLLSAQDRTEVNEGLLLAMHLQEKNFGRPAAEFLTLTADEQFASFLQTETRSTGHARCLTYVQLLRETADLYAFLDRTNLAAGARRLALHLALRIALDQPEEPTVVGDAVNALITLLEGAELHPPTQELLEQYRESRI
jgi:hypothetical protein